MSRRVVITGLGCLTSLGTGAETLWKNVLAGLSGIQRITRFDSSCFHAQCAGEINDFDPRAWFPSHKLKRIDRYAQFSLAVTQQALSDAGLAYDAEPPRAQIGVSFGTALGGIANAEQQHATFLAKGPDSIPAALALQVFGGSAHSNIAIYFGLRGYGTTNSNSCASGTVAVGEAFRVIRDGIADVMVAGASEVPLSPLTFGAFDVIKSMSKESTHPALACRPFDKKRSGFVMAEGAAALILEEREQALARGARIYAEVTGYALNNDAYHMTSSLPEGESAIAAIRTALAGAGIAPEQIDYINAHASGTAMNDAHEATAILQVFGTDHCPPVSGTKAATGHPLGATGAMEAILTALALHHGVIPPTINCDEPDIPTGFNLVRDRPQSAPLSHALSNSFGFGGINSCLVLKKA
jgi:3-oxoacyl-[acyl-carrier-protein] synthase II